MVSASENYLIFIGLIPSSYERYIDCTILWNYENNTFTKLPIYSEGGEGNYKWDNRVMCQPDIVESPEGSIQDMVDKVDITLTDKLTAKTYMFDVKSSQYADKITYFPPTLFK